MNQVWTRPEKSPVLAPSCAHVWRLDVAGDEGRRLLEPAYAVLTGEERERAARMRPGLPREEFVAGRGSLRLLLSAALGCDTASIPLTAGSHGKPELAGGANLPDLDFNVAHSRGLVLVALSRAGAVGVDVEYVNSAVDAVELSHTAFHPADAGLVQAVAEPNAEFYRLWTRREAVAKADGRGLTLPTEAFALGAGSGEEIRVELATEGGAAAGPVYFVRGIEAAAGFAAALALSRAGVALNLLELTLSALAR